jgi:hypothetical protein
VLREQEEEERVNKAKRPRTPSRVISNLILSPNPRERKTNIKGKEREL